LKRFSGKKFLIFEEEQYNLKRARSDVAGQDAEFHHRDYVLVIKKVRDFFRVEADVATPGPSRLVLDYATLLGWMAEKKIYEGHSEKEAVDLPTRERLDEMTLWIELDKPTEFSPQQT
jgi:hypothetical protein